MLVQVFQNFRLRNFRALPFAVLMMFATVLPVLAEPFENAVGKFANDEYSDTEEAVGAIATSGNPLAYSIISALQEGRLMADPDTKKIYLTQPDGKSIDAASGAPVASIPDSASAVRLNNHLRRAIEAALGGLTLSSPDPDKRILAAQSVFKTHDAAMLPLIDGALQKETNKVAKQAFTDARAAILLFKDDAGEVEKLDAIATIRARGGQDALAMLTDVPTDAPPSVARAAAGAIAAIQQSLALWSVVQNAWYGLSLGSVLLLAAIGLAITFGVMGVINMAHGEMVMIGAYVTFVVQQTIRTSYPGLFDYSLLIAVPSGVPRGRRDRHPDRAHHHPFPLRTPAGNSAGDLGPVAGVAAGGTHHVRSYQPGGRQPLLDERRVRTRADIDHL